MGRFDRGRAREIAICVLLFALNLVIAWRLLFTEYLIHYGSIEPVFFALADYLKNHWADPGWWRTWYEGMPFQYTYQPLLHYTVAFVSLWTGWSAARSFHVVLGVGYALGPVGVYLLAKRLFGRIDASLATAMIYSLWSPSAVLIPEIARDMGSAFDARRLHTATVYGDGPQMFGLTFLPFALFFIDRVIEKRTFARWIAASLCLIAVPATNIPAGLSLFLALVCYMFSGEVKDWLRRGLTITGLAITGYILVAHWIPPSGLQLTLHNTQIMEPQAQLAGQLSRYVWMIGLLLAVSFGLTRLTKQIALRFAALFLLVVGTVVLGKAWYDVSLMAQAERLHLVLEMAVAFALACAIPLLMRQHTVKTVTLTTLTIAAAWQFEHYKVFAHDTIQRVDMKDRGEYRIAQWLNENAQGARIFAPGSDAFWLNVFSDTPQVTACCDQNTLVQAPRYAHYEISTDEGAGDKGAEISTMWLAALGARYVVTSDAQSSEVFKDFHHPDKFKGFLQERWRLNGDAIFEVSPQLQSLAHWVQPSEVVTIFPENGIAIDPLKKYVAAITDSSRPVANLRWEGTRVAIIEGAGRPDDILSLQVAYHTGWRAEVVVAGDRATWPLKIDPDALGFMTTKPGCDVPCTIQFTFDGGTEAKVLRVITGSAWTGMLLVFLWQFARRFSARTTAA